MANSIVANGPPYGPPANLKTIIEFWRDRNMPEQITKDWLTRIGLSPNLTSQNLLALRYLDLIDENGNTTEAAERLRVARSDEYPSVLEGIVRKAYAKILEFADPSKDSKTRITDAFRQEQPSAQRSRMVTCFLGLCAMAGIPLKEAPPTRTESQNRVGKARKIKDTIEPTRALEPPRIEHNVTPAAASASSSVNGSSRVAEMLLAKLPEFNPEWSAEVQTKWFDAFTRLQESLQK